MRRKMSVALAAAIVAGTLAGCSGGTSGLPGDTTAADITVGKESVEKKILLKMGISRMQEQQFVY